jgi:hypothetical protein
MVTQILFGEQFEILEEQEKWSRIRLHYDGYEGWIDSKQLTKIDDSEALHHLSNQFQPVSSDLVQLAVSENEVTTILLGSSLPFFSNNKFRIGQKEYTYTRGACPSVPTTRCPRCMRPRMHGSDAPLSACWS